MTAHLSIGARRIGEGERCFVIAEAGVNHGGDVGLAHELVDAGAAAGADAVKFQSFTAELVASAIAPKAAYQERTTGSGGGQLEMLRRLELPVSALRSLKSRCDSRGVIFLSTPFDPGSARTLEELGVPAYKISSGDLTNRPLLEAVAAFARPMLLSTGMAHLEEVGNALSLVRTAGAPVALLHCISRYPADPADANLRAMATLEGAFGVPVGFSDHTPGIEVALAAAALGARIVEKHFTLDRGMPGPDHAASLEPDELARLVAGIRAVESALGDGVKQPAACEAEMRQVARRSVAAARDLSAGSRLSRDDLVALRPGSGISPMEIEALIGRPLRRSVHRGSLIGWDDLE